MDLRDPGLIEGLRQPTECRCVLLLEVPRDPKFCVVFVDGDGRKNLSVEAPQSLERLWAM